MMGRGLLFICSVCLVVQIGFGILSNGEDKKLNEQEKNLSLNKMEKKIDLFGQASYDHPHFALPGGDFGFGGGFDHHHYDHHDHHHVSHNDAALKGLLVPLAGVALLGAAALFASNPVLLQLGVITGKRRRRDVDEFFRSEKFRDIKALETFIDQLPKETVIKQEKKLLANYLQCSGASEYDNRCIERLTCEMDKPSANVTQLERHVLNIVTMDIMKNEYIPGQFKKRIEKAKKIGLDGGKCDRYFCSEIDK